MCDVLVVDDDVMTADVIARMLGHNGHKARTANSGKQALEAAREKMPEILVLDLRLGNDESGLDVLRSLQAAGFSGFTLIVSGATTTTDLSDWRALNIFVVIPKPFDMDELIERLEDATNLHDHMDKAVRTLQEINEYSQKRIASLA